MSMFVGIVMPVCRTLLFNKEENTSQLHNAHPCSFKMIIGLMINKNMIDALSFPASFLVILGSR